MRPNPVPGNLPSGAMTEQEILEQMTGPRQPQPPPPPPPHQHKSSPHHLPPAVMSFLAGHPLNMELISRPEGKQLLMGLESGNINIDHLVQQLNNPALQVTNRKFSSNRQNIRGWVGINPPDYILTALPCCQG